MLLPFAELDDFGSLDNPSFLERAAVHMPNKIKDSNIKYSTYKLSTERSKYDKINTKQKPNISLNQISLNFFCKPFQLRFQVSLAIQRVKVLVSQRIMPVSLTYKKKTNKKKTKSRIYHSQPLIYCERILSTDRVFI